VNDSRGATSEDIEWRRIDMKHHDSEHDKARRYFRALVDASLTARRPAHSAADRIDDSPAQHERWRAPPALWLGSEPPSGVRGA
jgi:hypothetical protein